MHIPFNKTYYPATSILAVIRTLKAGTISGNGIYTKKCHRFFEEHYGIKKALLTTSCTDALEMAGLLAGIRPGDEIILPSFTFVSTANAFALRGAKLVFADTLHNIPDIDPAQIEALITPLTRAIIVVHYSGIACEMDKIMDLARKHNLVVIEDAAHALDSYYNDKPLGSIGHFGTFSFHETKNIFCGEGGLLTINDENYISRAEMVWEKGTNGPHFTAGKSINTTGWIWVLPSCHQMHWPLFFTFSSRCLKRSRGKGSIIGNDMISYLNHLKIKALELPVIPSYATVNGNMFYFVMPSPEERDKMLAYLHSQGIRAIFTTCLSIEPLFWDRA